MKTGNSNKNSLLEYQSGNWKVVIKGDGRQ
jgi:hypothetical protein